MIWLVIILLLIIFFLLFLLFSKSTQDNTNFILEQSLHKQKNKEKILDLFSKDKQLSNEEIRSALKVSYRSVIRYMDELEKEKKVTLVGNTGRNVTYKIS
jgi:predicted HTH transcriptional regulator